MSCVKQNSFPFRNPKWLIEFGDSHADAFLTELVFIAGYSSPTCHRAIGINKVCVCQRVIYFHDLVATLVDLMKHTCHSK